MKRIIPVMVMLALGTLAQGAVFAKGPGNAAAPAVSPSVDSHAMANSNGNFSTDRDLGRARAEDRMSAQGTAHAKAATPKKSKKVASAKPVKPQAKPATPPAEPVDDGKA